MKLRHVLITWALALGVIAFLVPVVTGATAASRPNILFLLTDDQNPDTLGCFGGEVLTPTLDKLVQNIDFVPTIFELAGVRPPSAMKLDGVSLMPLVTQPQQTKWRDALFLEIGHTRAVCTERWKYIALRYPPQMQRKIADGTLGRPAYHMDVSLNLQEAALKRHPGYWDADQLYDLQADPGERVNLIKDAAHARTVAELQGRLKNWLVGFDRPFGEFVP